MVPTIRCLATLIAFAACSPVQPGPSPGNASPRPRDSGVKAHPCPKEALERFDPGRISPGPLRFESIACLGFRSGSFSVSHPILSPDGTAAADWHAGDAESIGIVQLDRPGRVDVPNRVTFRGFDSHSGLRAGSPEALAWSGDSRMLWSVRQPTATPSGFALAGLEPVAIGRDGAVRALPALRHSAGPLDGLLWVGGKGRALALFGARGGHYRPRHDDPEPTFAMVDAQHGRVLAEAPARSLPRLRPRLAERGLLIDGAAATLLADGRIRAVIQFGGWARRLRGVARNRDPIVHPRLWLSWTEGEPPREWPSPYPDDGFNRLVFVPGGERLLVLRPLEPKGLNIQCHMPPCPRPPPPTPVTGSIAELLEVSTGRVLWRLRARVESFWNQGVSPAVSGDGRFALIPLPPDDGWLPIALVDMRSGRIVQTIAPARDGSYPYGLAFTADGRRVVVSIGGSLRFYALGGR